jgi:molybdopterin synthase catalytic subunit
MSIEIRYFAAVREALECERETIELADLPNHPTVEDVWRVLGRRHPQLDEWRTRVRFALNQDFVGEDVAVEDGDEFAVIPPVAGGSGSRFAIRREPLDAEQLVDRVSEPSAGAVVTFEGIVRNRTDGFPVESLAYECYDSMALKTLRDIGADAEDRWPQIEVAIHHRIGTLEVGDTTVVIAVSSPHRQAAFEACRWTIDAVKQWVPIWKKESGPEGSRWVGWGS